MGSWSTQILHSFYIGNGYQYYYSFFYNFCTIVWFHLAYLLCCFIQKQGLAMNTVNLIPINFNCILGLLCEEEGNLEKKKPLCLCIYLIHLQYAYLSSTLTLFINGQPFLFKSSKPKSDPRSGSFYGSGSATLEGTGYYPVPYRTVQYTQVYTTSWTLEYSLQGACSDTVVL